MAKPRKQKYDTTLQSDAGARCEAKLFAAMQGSGCDAVDGYSTGG